VKRPFALEVPTVGFLPDSYAVKSACLGVPENATLGRPCVDTLAEAHAEAATRRAGAHILRDGRVVAPSGMCAMKDHRPLFIENPAPVSATATVPSQRWLTAWARAHAAAGGREDLPGPGPQRARAIEYAQIGASARFAGLATAREFPAQSAHAALQEHSRGPSTGPLSMIASDGHRPVYVAESPLHDRAQLDGLAAMGDGDLVALAAGCSPSQAAELLAQVGGLAPLEREGADLSSLTVAQQRQLEAGLLLGRRVAVQTAQRADAEIFSTPTRIARWGHAQLDHQLVEQIWAVCLDNAHRLLTVRLIASGGTVSASTDRASILRTILRTGASVFVLVHNHPSGNPEPSTTDLQMTHQLHAAALAAGLIFLDHVIVGAGGGHVSLYDRGQLTSPTTGTDHP
jgi:DNA repair protein RadC